MKVLFLTKYDTQGASSRYRSHQFYKFYEKNGLCIDNRYLFGNEYLVSLYNGNREIKVIIQSYIRRFFILFTVKRYDLLIIEKELFPYLPAFFEKILNILGIKYFVDYDDALFHQYDNSKNRIVRFFLSRKIAKVMKYSSMVIAGNKYLSNYAILTAKAKNVTIIPTVIDLEKYDKILKNKKENDTVVIGWIGSPSTSKYLNYLENILIKLSKKYNIQVNIIGSTISPFSSFSVNLIPWDDKNEIEEMKKFDIGIMPLVDSPWEKGKCGFKLIQYMGCSLPVVASPVGVNSEIIEENKNGFLASTVEEWSKSLEFLIQNKEQRHLFGIKGREIVKKKYSKKNIEKKLLNLYKEGIDVK